MSELPVWTNALTVGSDPDRVGTLASRPSAASVGDGWYYYATDEDRVYVTAAGAWGAVGTGLIAGADVSGLVSSVAKAGGTALTGDVTLTAGAGITINEVGQDLEIAGSGAAGGMTKLFDSTLAAPANAIDTGAGGISTAFDLLDVFIFARTDEAVVASALVLTLNNDASAIYDLQFVRGANATASAGSVVAAAGWSIATAGANQQAGSFGIFHLAFPTYSQTVAHKVAACLIGWADSTAANNRAQSTTLRYRSTTAISRMKVAAPATKNLITGSRLLVYGS